MLEQNAQPSSARQTGKMNECGQMCRRLHTTHSLHGGRTARHLCSERFSQSRCRLMHTVTYIVHGELLLEHNKFELELKI